MLALLYARVQAILEQKHVKSRSYSVTGPYMEGEQLSMKSAEQELSAYSPGWLFAAGLIALIVLAWRLVGAGGSRCRRL